MCYVTPTAPAYVTGCDRGWTKQARNGASHRKDLPILLATGFALAEQAIRGNWRRRSEETMSGPHEAERCQCSHASDIKKDIAHITLS